MASRVRRSPLTVAIAPAGARHPAPSAARNARSAVIDAAVAASSSTLARRSVSASSARTSIAKAPWPGAGRQIDSGIGVYGASVLARRSIPATARIKASHSPRSSFARRVSTLPRIAMNRRSGRSRRSCERRRGLPVATTAPWGKSATRLAVLHTRASRGS
jgi:hypothetical protein